MKFTFLGHTGVTVSRICLGCMSYGSPAWRPWVLEEEPSRPFFRQAVEAGINSFDTADMYSLGVSEEVTGRALRGLARLEECVVATKVFHPLSDRPNMGGLSRKHIVQGCEASLRRLGMEVIDLYQVHRFDAHTPNEEMLSALDLLGDQEVIETVRRVAGARGVPPAQVALAWLLSRPAVAAPIIGATKLHHLDDAIAALDLELSIEELAELEAPYQPHPVRGF